ncbi:hypothetical protein ECANGB1_1703 [Enterospora canceri]|uniref:Uncharacterized protein n=1 Tax=Enterospora canceri TaxID=1081671 RepID=A0A1Y1S971_9MICR|nr:hypothetical protein ECANGB1_1703 [Enterospora canceri]
MFEFIGNMFKSIGEFFSGLFSTFWSGVFTIVALICLTVVIVALIINYQKNHQVEEKTVSTDEKVV